MLYSHIIGAYHVTVFSCPGRMRPSILSLDKFFQSVIHFIFVQHTQCCFVNPNSHGVFFVSRLTAVGHIRHPFKADLGEKWRRLWCLCVRPSARTRPAKWFKTERRRQIFTFFAITSPVGLWFKFLQDWLNPQSMLIPNLFRLFWMFASKGFKSS